MAAGSRVDRGRRAWSRGTLAAGILVACAKSPSPPSVTHPIPSAALPSPPSGWPYWQTPSFALPASVDLAHAFEDEPDPAWLQSDEVWHRSAGSILTKLRAQGLALRKTGRVEAGLGAFYEERARRGAPLLITADALFAVAHLALASALADVEAGVERVDLLSMLRQLDTRLSAEVSRARPDLLGGYRLARSTVAVALALVDASYEVPSDLAESVSLELARIRAHDGVAESPVFGAAIDYGSMSRRGAASSTGPAMFEAAEWLAHAPFLLDGRGEVGSAEVEVGTARTHTRAALLLARLLTPEVDTSASAAFSRLDRVALFALGAADDLSPADLAQLARANAIDLRGGADVVNTAKLDHLRHAASRQPTLFDESGGLREVADGGAASWRPPRSMRLLPLRATPDGLLLQRLVFPFVGAASSADMLRGALSRVRAMPSALDVAAWLGSGAARLELSSRGDSRYGGFDVALSSPRLPSGALSRHASLFESGLDAISTWLRPSEIDVRVPGLFSDAADRRKLETALVAWTLLRHDALAFGHGSAPTGPPTLAPTRRGPGLVLIEPHPETIASLLGMIRQARRGFAGIGALPGGAPSAAILDETESILTLALEGSIEAAARESTFVDLEQELAELPGRVAALEQRAGQGAEPAVIDVHLDLGSGQVLEEATGTIDELFVRVQDPVAHRAIVVVGASIPHFEFAEKAGVRGSDVAWSARLRGGLAPNRDAFVDLDIVAPD